MARKKAENLILLSSRSSFSAPIDAVSFLTPKDRSNQDEAPQRATTLPASSPFTFVKMLNDRLSSGILEEAEAALYAEMRKNEIRKVVKLYHRYKIAYDSGKERFYTKYPGDYHRRIYAVTEDDLYARLFAIYDANPLLRKDSYLIGDLFPRAILWIRETQNKSENTLIIHERDWRRFFASSPLAKIDIRDVQPSDYYKAFVEVTKGGTITKERFSEIKTCFSYIYDYVGIVCGLGLTSPMASPLFDRLKFKDDECRRDEIKTKALTRSQTTRLIEYCESDPPKQSKKVMARIRMNRLGLHLNIYLGLRFSELFGLRWCDIITDPDSGLSLVCVRGQRLSDGKWVAHTKKGTDEGKRSVILIPAAMQVLEQLRAQSCDETYVFFWNTMAYENYRRECKRAFAYALGIPYRTKEEQLANRDLLRHYVTHTARSTFASIIYDSGEVTDRQLQKLMGHTTSDMTRRYCHDIRGQATLQAAQISAFAGIEMKKDQAS